MQKCKMWVVFITTAGCLLLAGCATIMHGTSQSVGFSSKPTNAEVIIDSEPRGSTPLIVDLKRKDHHVVTIQMAGYEPFGATITRSTSGWVWGNIVFGGLIGLAVDAISGGLYKLKPEEINAELGTTSQGSIDENGIIYVKVVLEPNPQWERIGNLNSVL